MIVIKTSRDVLWKAIIEDLFDDFLRFFYANAIEEFDFDKGFEFLDKELSELSKQFKKGGRYADKLVKVYTKEGKESWILVHIEVQGYRDPDFAARMFSYYYRILEKYQQQITALVIYTDDDPNFHPKAYVRSYLGTKVEYSFRTYKLLEKTLEDFTDKSNPFAVVMETAWHALKTKKLGEAHIAELYIRLVRSLFKYGYNRKRIDDLISFIAKFANFEKSPIKRKFGEELDIILQKNKPMGIQEAIIEDAKRQITEQVTEQITEQVTEQVTEKMQKDFDLRLKSAVLKLRKSGHSDDEIGNVLDISSDDIERILKS